jgi:beta-N-acetylhexosaminidase
MSKGKSTAAAPLAAILGCAGHRLGDAERRLFQEADPLGFILFARNIDEPAQVAALVRDLRGCAGRQDALVLIDQEGGRVARLKPPHWRAAPPAARIGALAGRGRAAGRRAAWLNARLMAAELQELAINVDCAPVLDLPVAGAHDIIGDRAFAAEPATMTELGRAACEGFLAGGVLPVIKHIPGHGRALADSHEELPAVSEGRDLLEQTDFVPFRNLADMPLAMTAHILYRAIDSQLPATTSPVVIGEIIRGAIGFDGLLMTDDLSMGALGGSLADRTRRSLAAGCDVVLHCNGDLAEMAAVCEGARALDDKGSRRLERALAAVAGGPEEFDEAAGLAELGELLGPGIA